MLCSIPPWGEWENDRERGIIDYPLDRKTTLLILGDARNNYNDPQAWALRLMRERVKGIIWLNLEGQWGVGDSVMPLYAPHCDLVRECRTLTQLAEVVDGLIQGWWRRRGAVR